LEHLHNAKAIRIGELGRYHTLLSQLQLHVLEAFDAATQQHSTSKTTTTTTAPQKLLTIDDIASTTSAAQRAQWSEFVVCEGNTDLLSFSPYKTLEAIMRLLSQHADIAELEKAIAQLGSTINRSRSHGDFSTVVVADKVMTQSQQIDAMLRRTYVRYNAQCTMHNAQCTMHNAASYCCRCFYLLMSMSLLQSCLILHCRIGDPRSQDCRGLQHQIVH
jgi:mannose-6-phosphate isomerase class I